MISMYRTAQALGISCSLYTALCLCAVRGASAQAVPPMAAGDPPAAISVEAPAAEAAQPAAAGDLASEVAALRAQAAELKSKQEEAEAAALLSEAPAETAIEAEPLRVYGFMDLGLDKFLGGASNGGAVVRPTRALTFVFGNLNLYFDAIPLEHLRCLAEIRLTVAPHGEETSVVGQYARNDTTAFDFSSPSSQSFLRLGGLYIERAWSQYEFSKAFTLQWGMFLNPFGIWNLDHGTPTLIALMLPGFIAGQMMPTRLLGIHGYGSVFVGNSELGYAIHVSNGRTPTDFDYKDDKAVGGRLYWATEGEFGRLVLGASGYVGRYVDQHRSLVVEENGYHLGEQSVVQYTEEVFGLDVALDVGALRLRAESVLRWVSYADGKAEQAFSNAGTLQSLPNRAEWSGYILGAYRTPWRVEPYLMAEGMDNRPAVLPRWAGMGALAFSQSNAASITLSFGFNVELTTHTIFKAQVAWSQVWDRRFEEKLASAPYLFTRLVSSF